MVPLNYHNLTLLNQFESKAKPLIGAVKVSEMLNNELYTFDISIKAAITGDLELIDLSKKLNHESKTVFNLINAIESYFYNINSTSSNADFILKSKSLLPRFANHLNGLQINGASYRFAVDEFLLNVEIEDKTFTINMARKFYRYWKAANRLVDESNQKDINLMAKKMAFIQLWDSIDDKFLTALEICQLAQYTDSLNDKRLPEKNIIQSSKIAKIIIIELRNEQPNFYENYRHAIDITKVLFEGEELEKLFLIVSREFHAFC